MVRLACVSHTRTCSSSETEPTGIGDQRPRLAKRVPSCGPSPPPQPPSWSASKKPLKPQLLSFDFRQHCTRRTKSLLPSVGVCWWSGPGTEHPRLCAVPEGPKRVVVRRPIPLLSGPAFDRPFSSKSLDYDSTKTGPHLAARAVELVMPLAVGVGLDPAST